jgi:hypothetical protein
VQADLTVIDGRLLTPGQRAILKQALLQVKEQGATTA